MKTTTMHGVFMDVLGLGVLLTGKSGIGKSELALGLVNRGHRLIADDSVILENEDETSVLGSCPPILQDFLEVRGLGILNIRVMFGDMAIKERKRLQLIVHIVTLEDERMQNLDRLHGMHCTHNILGVDIPEVTIPVVPGRSLAVLVECAVRNQVLKLTGYEASAEFIARQNEYIKNKTKNNK